MITVEALVPESQAYGANHLCACKLYSLEDLKSFVRATHLAPDGTRVMWQGIQLPATWREDFAGLPERPSHDPDEQIDLPAATACMQGLIVLEEAPESPLPAPTGLVLSQGVDLVAAYGLVRISEE